MEDPGEVDVYVCHVKEDEALAVFLSEKLSKEGLSVWHKHGADISTKGQALFKANTVVIIISVHSINAKFCNDELSLAYISDKPIMPVSAEDYKSIEPQLNFSMKLIVAKLNWSFFKADKNGKFSEEFLQTLTKSIQKVHTRQKERTAVTSKLLKEDVEIPSSTEEKSLEEQRVRIVMNHWRAYMRDLTRRRASRNDFWLEHFGQNKEVPWLEFREAFLKTYREQITSQFSEEGVTWLVTLMYGDVFDLRKTITKKSYSKFCGDTRDDPDRFFHRLLDYAGGMRAMKEVLKMNSTVRLIAIQNLAGFKTPAVVSALQKLLSDTNANMRANAAIALGKIGSKNPHVIWSLMKKLSDNDRLVREAVCLSLGHLKANEAISKIVDLWRNDIISDVRNAALSALKLIDSTEAKEAIRVTQLLADEVNELKQQIATKKKKVPTATLR